MKTRKVVQILYRRYGVGMNNEVPKAMKTLDFRDSYLPFDNDLITSELNRFVLFSASEQVACR